MEEKDKKQETKAKEVKDEKKVEQKVNEPKKEVKTETKKTVETKKQEKPKNENTQKESEKPKFKAKQGKKEKNTSWIIALVVIALIALITVAIVFTMDTPSKSVDGMLQALKSGNFDKVEEYVNYKEIMSTSSITDEEELNNDTQKLFFDKLSWKITKTSQDGNNATVDIEITNKDFKTILSNYMQKVLKIAFTGQNPNDQEMQNYLVEELNNEQVQLTTNTKTIQLEKKDGKWKVVSSEELVDTLLPGLNEFSNSLN